MEKENGNGNTVLLTVIGVATLLVALVGATFAYFSAQITVNSKESIILTTRKPTGLTYAREGEALNLPNAVPGATSTGKFTVLNGDEYVTQTYDLKLVVNTNEFTVTTNGMYETLTDDQVEEGKRQLILTLSATSNKEGRTIALRKTEYNLTDGTTPLSDNDALFIDNQEISPNEKHTYTVTIEFKYYNFKQDNNQDKTFDAVIEIDDPRSVSTSAAASTTPVESGTEPAGE